MTQHIRRDVNFPPSYILWFVQNMIESVVENDLKNNEVLSLDLLHSKYTNDQALMEAVKRTMAVNGYDVKLVKYKENDEKNMGYNLFSMSIKFKKL